MISTIAGGVDCDLHPAVPQLTSLLPYLNDYWRDQVTTRGMVDLVSQSYPSNSPITARPDWRPSQGKPGSSLADMKAQALDPHRVSFGICNPLYGVQMVFSEDMADAFCRALMPKFCRFASLHLQLAGPAFAFFSRFMLFVLDVRLLRQGRTLEIISWIFSS